MNVPDIFSLDTSSLLAFLASIASVVLIAPVTLHGKVFLFIVSLIVFLVVFKLVKWLLFSRSKKDSENKPN